MAKTGDPIILMPMPLTTAMMAKNETLKPG